MYSLGRVYVIVEPTYGCGAGGGVVYRRLSISIGALSVAVLIGQGCDVWSSGRFVHDVERRVVRDFIYLSAVSSHAEIYQFFRDLPGVLARILPIVVCGARNDRPSDGIRDEKLWFIWLRYVDKLRLIV